MTVSKIRNGAGGALASFAEGSAHGRLVRRRLHPAKQQVQTAASVRGRRRGLPLTFPRARTTLARAKDVGSHHSSLHADRRGE